MLGIKYGPEIDMWSFGCILVEFYKGTPLFPGESEKEQICLVVETLGFPPKLLLDESPRKHHFFNDQNEINPYTSKRGIV